MKAWQGFEEDETINLPGEDQEEMVEKVLCENDVNDEPIATDSWMEQGRQVG